MSNRTERDLAPEPREMPRRRFMIAGEHVILRAFEQEDAERCYRWRRDDRSHIGNASIHDIDWTSRTGWFGLFVGEPTAWNRGFGGDAIHTLVRFAFAEMNLTKLRINVFEYNDRAKHVLEAHGFVREGCLRRDFFREGTHHDIVIYSIFREDTAS